MAWYLEKYNLKNMNFVASEHLQVCNATVYNPWQYFIKTQKKYFL